MNIQEIKPGERPEWVEKDWGQTRCLHHGVNFEIHELKIKEGGFCSIHRHRKWNKFQVLNGRLNVDICKNEASDSPRNGRLLVDDDWFIVGPNEIHQFRAEADSHIVEIYWQADIDPNDIERFSSGGINNDSSL